MAANICPRSCGLKNSLSPRQVTNLLSSLGAIPVGMPLQSIPDALSKATINGCVIHREVVPAIKAKYNSLVPDLKKIIDNNSGMATSAWLGKIQQANDVPDRPFAVARGNTIYTVSAPEAQEFRRKSRAVEVEWVQDMDKRGFEGKTLRVTAHSLNEKHTKTTKT